MTDEPETVRYADELAQRLDELVFVTQDAEGAAALRDFGLLAICRPDGGLWNCVASRSLLGRDVALVKTRPFGNADEWADRDRSELSQTCRRIGVFLPVAFEGRSPPSDLAEFVERQRNLSLGAAGLAEEARACLRDTMPKVELPEGIVGFVGAPPQVRPIRVDLHPVPEMDPKLIPEPYRAWLEDIAQRACCPLDLPAISAIVATAGVVGRSVAIRPKKHDNWTVVPNLWGMGVLPPGYLKTHCLDEPKRPLDRLEIEARGRYAQDMAGFEVEKLIAEGKAAAAAAALKDASRKKKSDVELRLLAAEALAKPDSSPPTLRRYVVNDATVEKLGELLVDNPNGLLVFRDELIGFLRNLEKQGHENDRAFYLEGWNGDKSFTYDRIGRGSIFIPSNTISVLGGIQPGVLGRYLRSMASGENDDGLIQRFQLAVYPDVDQDFVNVDRWPDTEAKDRAYAIFRALAALDPTAIGAEGDEGEIPYLHFEDDAQGFFDEWRADLENRVRSAQESACLTSHVAKFRSLMPSLAHLFHLIDVVGKVASGPVSLAAARRAAAFCDYLEQHARRVYQMAFDGDVEPAQRLAGRIKASLPNPFSVRQVVQKGWSGLSATEDVERAVAVLEAHDWVRCVEIPPGPTGGRPKVEIHINPRVLGNEP